MARKPGSSPSAIKSRAARTAAALAPAGGAPTAAATPKKKRTNPVQFFREVRAEARKITWTTRKETWITSVMVFMMVVLAALFFSAVDGLLGLGAKALLSFAAG